VLLRRAGRYTSHNHVQMQADIDVNSPIRGYLIIQISFFSFEQCKLIRKKKANHKILVHLEKPHL
jgi:hypothetical protein